MKLTKRQKKAKDKAILAIKDLQHNDEPETGHELADNALCELLKEIGMKDVITEYKKITRWWG